MIYMIFQRAFHRILMLLVLLLTKKFSDKDILLNEILSMKKSINLNNTNINKFTIHFKFWSWRNLSLKKREIVFSLVQILPIDRILINNFSLPETDSIPLFLFLMDKKKPTNRGHDDILSQYNHPTNLNVPLHSTRNEEDNNPSRTRRLREKGDI